MKWYVVLSLWHKIKNETVLKYSKVIAKYFKHDSESRALSREVWTVSWKKKKKPFTEKIRCWQTERTNEESQHP